MPALLPISVAGFRRDVPPRSDRNEPSSPFICQLLCYFDWAVRIICAGNNQCGIRQRKLWNLSERWSRKLFSFEVRRCHEERPCNREVGTMLARPADAQKTSHVWATRIGGVEHASTTRSSADIQSSSSGAFQLAGSSRSASVLRSCQRVCQCWGPELLRPGRIKRGIRTISVSDALRSPIGSSLRRND